jgi:predicted phosphodiesterase
MRLLEGSMMHVADWGQITGDLLVFGGAYSNLAALHAVLALRGQSRVINTGDLVAYCAQAAETVACARRAGLLSIAGNVERQLGDNALDCGCGFADGSACDLLSAAWYGFANLAIGSEERAWMSGLPDAAVFHWNGRRVAVIHGGVTDPVRFLWPSTEAAVFEEELAALLQVAGPIDVVLSGHSGVAFHRRIKDVDWINAGVIGMPPNDGRVDTRYARVTQQGVIFERLVYDVTLTVDAMKAAGLTQGYHKALQTGYWPSEDVLPPALRRVPLVPSFSPKGGG